MEIEEKREREREREKEGGRERERKKERGQDRERAGKIERDGEREGGREREVNEDRERELRETYKAEYFKIKMRKISDKYFNMRKQFDHHCFLRLFLSQISVLPEGVKHLIHF